MLHEDIPTVNISKLNYWLVICIAKNFIWTTLKMIFSIFWLFCTLRFQIFKYCPIITNHASMEILFIQHSDDAYISIKKNWPLWLVLCSSVTFEQPDMSASDSANHESLGAGLSVWLTNDTRVFENVIAHKRCTQTLYKQCVTLFYRKWLVFIIFHQNIKSVKVIFASFDSANHMSLGRGYQSDCPMTKQCLKTAWQNF